MYTLTLEAFGDELMKLAAERLSPKDKKRSNKIYADLVKLSPIKVKVTADADQYGGGYFDQKSKEIGLSSKDWKTLAHEMGHAELDKHILGRMIQHPIVRTAFNYIPFLSIGAGVLMAKGKKWGVLLPLAATAPTLVSEAMATSKGKGKLEGIKLSPDEMDAYQKKLREAFLSYGATPVSGAALGGLTYLTARLMANLKSHPHN